MRPHARSTLNPVRRQRRNPSQMRAIPPCPPTIPLGSLSWHSHGAFHDESPRSPARSARRGSRQSRPGLTRRTIRTRRSSSQPALRRERRVRVPSPTPRPHGARARDIVAAHPGGHAAAAAFGNKNEELYQLKVDNTGDAREDLVFQITFTGPPGNQRVRLRGPDAARSRSGRRTRCSSAHARSQGCTGDVLGSPNGIAAVRRPARRSVLHRPRAVLPHPPRSPAVEAGPLSLITQGPLDVPPRWQAVDFVRGFNDLAIVDRASDRRALRRTARTRRFGVWGTTSSARGSTNGHSLDTSRFRSTRITCGNANMGGGRASSRSA